MLKNKIVAAGLATVLAMPFGLAACGSQPAAKQETKTEATTTESKDASSDKLKEAAEASKILYWEGKTADGKEVFYMEDEESKSAILAIGKEDGSDGKGWVGKYANQDTKVIITDEATGETVTINVLDATQDLSALKVNIDGYGDIEMKPTTQGAFTKEIEGVVDTAVTAAVTEAVSQAADELSKTVLYFEGDLANGLHVDYADDAEAKTAALVISNADLSDVKSWSGKVSVTDGKTTITDDETKQTISFTATGDSKSSSIKLNIDGYGEVELKGVTGGEVGDQIAKAVEQLAKEAK